MESIGEVLLGFRRGSETRESEEELKKTAHQSPLYWIVACWLALIPNLIYVGKVGARPLPRELVDGAVTAITSVAVIPNCSILATVGQKMASTPGVSAALFNALAKANINVRDSEL
ncbi:hypothetical protein RHMOL_Rhmol07G0223200 [Rhododendron molle]|uniref:Uncharacterized protein n=1 Tax=Rhododendron molle TaxID=49168 RepID=A0ACC0N4Y3_RHOML|nr:hypothetical protein RHMOL_Rhmol07G0223200 [Rhododendron molle]